MRKKRREKMGTGDFTSAKPYLDLINKEEDDDFTGLGIKDDFDDFRVERSIMDEE